MGVDLKKELGAEGRVVLTSSTATQTSFQQEDAELSLYTQYLLEGIETGAADDDEDGKIHAHELHQYAKAKVKEVKPKQELGIIIDREGFNILLSQAPVNDPELIFRKLVEKCASKGEISSYRREILKIKQQEFLLTDEKANEIINSVLEPFRRHLVNLERYRENYRKQVDKKYPLDKTLAQDLKDWGQQVLGLKDEDIAKIEQDVNAKKEADHQHQQEAQQQEQEEYNNKLKQYEQEFLKAVEREYPLSENTRDRINIWQQSLGLRDEDIKQIEQPILAAKYQEKLKEKEKERQGQQGQVSTSQPSVTPVASPNATTTSSSSSSQNQSSTPQPKSPPTSSPKKTRILVGGGIAAALALALTFSFMDRTPQPEQNGNTQPPVSEPESPTTSQMTAEEFLSRGWDKSQNGDNQGAIEDYTKAIELKPYYSLAYINRGLVRSNLGDNKGAIEDFTQAIEIDQNWGAVSESYFGLPSAYYTRGIAHSDLGDNKGAIEDYTQAIALKPDYVSAYINRGLVRSNLGDNKGAIEDYTQAIALKPDSGNAYYNRGLARSNLGDNKGAIEDYQKAADLYQQQGKTEDYQDAINRINELQK